MAGTIVELTNVNMPNQPINQQLPSTGINDVNFQNQNQAMASQNNLTNGPNSNVSMNDYLNNNSSNTNNNTNNNSMT